MNEVFFYAGGIILLFWGVVYVIALRTVRWFGEISTDKNRILTMEWFIEGVLMVLVGFLVTLGTALSFQVALAYWLSASALLFMAILSLATGARTSQLPFKLCPAIFTVSAFLIFAGTFL